MFRRTVIRIIVVMVTILAVVTAAKSAFAGVYGEIDHVVKDGNPHQDYIAILSTRIGVISPTWLGVSSDGWWESCLGASVSPVQGVSILVLGGLDSDDPHWHYVALSSLTYGDLLITNAFENGGGGPANRFVANGSSGVAGLRVGVMAQVGQGYGPRVDYARGHWATWVSVVQNGEHTVWHTAINWSR